MEKKMMKLLIMFALGMNYWSCSGFPVYDYDPSSLRDALSASVAKVNSQSLSLYLFRAFRSSLKRPTAVCRSTVKVSGQQVQGVRAHCSWSSSTSESLSSEEMIFRDMLGSHKWRNNYPFGLIPDESISEQLYDRSLEIMRRAFPPGNRRYPNYRHRARINTDFE
ncbi:secreted phosphoprotein 24 isoform X2 [Sapajus apella]|uniref:Secreted phosphoprotein 24 isoform X2 n=1 Tax=Sapajus apella TaxID=9515 RepID=A0A6J3HUL6_SAPAP|nr:secreted phosphoprotein 24 isoform X2 [Sapajus apella]